MPHKTPWDRREPITDAMLRHGTRDAFQSAVDGGDRNEAVRILCAVGADEETAWQMIAILIPDQDGPPPPGT